MQSLQPYNAICKSSFIVLNAALTVYPALSSVYGVSVILDKITNRLQSVRHQFYFFCQHDINWIAVLETFLSVAHLVHGWWHNVRVMGMKSNALKQMIFQDTIMRATDVCDMYSIVCSVPYLYMTFYILSI